MYFLNIDVTRCRSHRHCEAGCLTQSPGLRKSNSQIKSARGRRCCQRKKRSDTSAIRIDEPGCHALPQPGSSELGDYDQPGHRPDAVVRRGPRRVRLPCSERQPAKNGRGTDMTLADELLDRAERSTRWTSTANPRFPTFAQRTRPGDWGETRWPPCVAGRANANATTPFEKRSWRYGGLVARDLIRQVRGQCPARPENLKNGRLNPTS
jgi:hypothetical protein